MPRCSKKLCLKSFLHPLQEKFQLFFQKGGLKLKLIGFSLIVILVTVLTLSSIIIHLMKGSIEQKAFEVATTSIERIADFSNNALLERSYENRLTLNEMIKKIRLSNIQGMLDISIYAHYKTDKASTFKYVAGFGRYENGTLLDDAELITSLENSTSSAVVYDTRSFEMNDESVEAYRFIKPIRYTFQNKTMLLGVVVLHYDKEAVTGVVYHTIYIAIVMTLMIILLTTVLIYFAGLRFTRPILSIAKAANAVSSGNLDIHVQVTTHDEIGELAHQFNHMVNGLREREKMQVFISDSTIDMIQEDSQRQLILGGEYKTLTFLFSDIRGFTAMSESKEPEEVVRIINFYLNLQSKIIKNNGGDIDKFVGDEIMVSFAGDDGVERAIQSAIAIQECIATENAKRDKNGETICHVGIGINRGEVIVGNMGSHERMDFTSIGPVVNLASRLCSNAAAGQILIEQATYDLAHNDFDTTREEPISVKGIDHPIEIVSIVVEGA